MVFKNNYGAVTAVKGHSNHFGLIKTRDKFVYNVPV